MKTTDDYIKQLLLKLHKEEPIENSVDVAFKGVSYTLSLEDYDLFDYVAKRTIAFDLIKNRFIWRDNKLMVGTIGDVEIPIEEDEFAFDFDTEEEGEHAYQLLLDLLWEI